MNRPTRLVALIEERVDMNHRTTKLLPRLCRLWKRVYGPWPQARAPHRGDLTTPIVAARPIHRLA